MKQPITRLRWTAFSLGFSSMLVIFSAAPAGAPTVTITSAPYNASTGSADNSAAIQAAINAVGSGGTVVVPAGNFLSNSITLKSNMTLQLSAGATLQRRPWGPSPKHRFRLRVPSLVNVIIDGSGVMDGQGQAWWTAFNNGGTDNRPPAMIELTGCTGVTVSGITVQNSPKFHIQFLGNGVNVTASGLTITAPWPSPNTDGIDLRGTNVNILNCYISDGDDVVQIGGSNACSGVTVSGCSFGTGHGLSIGSITSGNVTNVLVNNCVFNGTQYGLRLKSNNTEGGITSNVTYSNITMSNIMDNPILMYSYYPDVPTSPTTDTGSAANSTTPYWENIKFENVVASEAATGKSNVGILWGLPQAPVSDVSFDACTLTGAKIMEVFNTQGVTFNCNCLINGLAPSNSAAVTTYNASMAGSDNVDFAACGPTPTFTTSAATATRTAFPTVDKHETSEQPPLDSTRTPTDFVAHFDGFFHPDGHFNRHGDPDFNFVPDSGPFDDAHGYAYRDFDGDADLNPHTAFNPNGDSVDDENIHRDRLGNTVGFFDADFSLYDDRVSHEDQRLDAHCFHHGDTHCHVFFDPDSRHNRLGHCLGVGHCLGIAYGYTFGDFDGDGSVHCDEDSNRYGHRFFDADGLAQLLTSTLHRRSDFVAYGNLIAFFTPSKTPTALPPTLTFSPTQTATPSSTATALWTASPTGTATEMATATFSSSAPPISKPIPFPNPVRGGTVQIHFVLAIVSSDVKIRIFTTAFRKVLTVDLGPLPAGVNEPSITLLMNGNRPLATGSLLPGSFRLPVQGTAIGKLLVQR